ncbi:MAG: universal stress protein [Actinomycetes bacterium]
MSTSPGRVVVGVDGSPSSVGALRWAAGYARCSGAPVHVVEAWVTPHVAGFPLDPAGDGGRAKAQADLEAVVAAAELPAEVTVTVQLVDGHPTQALLDAARSADLLVLGSRGHGGFTGMLLGSVSQHCVQHASCPVLVVRHG